MFDEKRPKIIGIGGTTRAGSSSEMALRHCLAEASKLGAEVTLFSGESLILPLYDPREARQSEESRQLILALRDCDGVVIATPGYHGSMSGLIKNVLDYIEELREDVRPYLDGRAVGLIVCAYGWQATGTTLTSMRSVIHALRGWPTPLGVGINSALETFDSRGNCSNSGVAAQLALLAQQVVGFSRRSVA